jgi:hypothetical protein
LLSFGTESFVFQFAKENIKIRLFRITSFPAVLYGCETWSLTLREEQRPSVFANRVLRKICGSERDEETGDWRKLHNEAYNDMCSSTEIIRLFKSIRIRCPGHVAYKRQTKCTHGFGGEI